MSIIYLALTSYGSIWLSAEIDFNCVGWLSCWVTKLFLSVMLPMSYHQILARDQEHFIADLVLVCDVTLHVF